MFGYRTDVATLRPPKRLPDGRLRVDAFITKPGIFPYTDSTKRGGIRYELRRPSEVFHHDTLESFKQMPVTHGHPPTMLDADNAKYYMVGSTGEGVMRASPGPSEPDHVATSLMIADRATIDAIEGGDEEVSVGYGCVIDDTGGKAPEYATPDNPDGRYDCEQLAIRGNHLAAAVGRGRAGRTARVRMDSELTAEERDKLRDSKFAVPGQGKLPIEDEEHVRAAMSRFSQTEGLSADEEKTAFHKIVAAASKFGIDATGFKEKYGGRYDAVINRTSGGAMDPEKMQQAITSLGAQLKEAQERADKADADVATERKRADIAEGMAKQQEKTIGELRTQLAARADASDTAALTAMRERAERAEGAVSRFDARFSDGVRSRVALIVKAQRHMASDFRFDDLSDRQIMAAVVSRLDSTADVSTKVSDGVIEGQFIALTGREDAYARSLARSSEVLVQNQKEATRKDAKAESEDRLRNMWKEPLPNDIRAAHARAGKES